MPDHDWRADIEQMRAAGCSSFLFLCVANSARSQLAEAIARHLAPPTVQVRSAGSMPTRVHPQAVAVLTERGVGTDHLVSKDVEALFGTEFDAVITLCAEENCPVWLGETERFHWPLPDPAGAQQAEQREAFAAVRDELWGRLSVLFANQEQTS